VSTKKKTTTSSTTTAAPWAQGAIDSSLSGLNSAAQQSQANSNASQPYLMSAIQSLGSGTPSYLQSANNQLENTINGGGLDANQYTSALTSNPYLSQLTGPNQYIDQLLQTTSHENPYLAQTADRIGQQTGAQLASSFGGSGRSGSGLAALLGGQGIGDALSTFYGNQYNNDQQLRASALTNAAQMQQSGITNAAQLSQQGTQSAAALQDAALARQQQAILASGGQYAANLQGISPLLQLASTSTLLPLQGASAYSSGVTQATAPYASQNSTQTQTSGGLGSILGPALGLASALGGGGLTSMLGGAGGSMGGMLSSAMPGLSAGLAPITANLSNLPNLSPLNLGR
jgi:hypothetical protein